MFYELISLKIVYAYINIKELGMIKWILVLNWRNIQYTKKYVIFCNGRLT